MAYFAECRGEASRLREVRLANGAARTITEAGWRMADPLGRPRRAQLLYRQGDEGLWLVNTDGRQNRRLKLADGGVGSAGWAPGGRTVLYLNVPTDTTQLNAIREFTPDDNTDKMVGKTSQFAAFSSNRDSSVFVGASRNAASPHVLLLLRVTRREFTLCEHKASRPREVAPRLLPGQPARLLHQRPARQDRHLQHRRGETGRADRAVTAHRSSITSMMCPSSATASTLACLPSTRTCTKCSVLSTLRVSPAMGPSTG